MWCLYENITLFTDKKHLYISKVLVKLHSKNSENTCCTDFKGEGLVRVQSFSSTLQASVSAPALCVKVLQPLKDPWNSAKATLLPRKAVQHMCCFYFKFFDCFPSSTAATLISNFLHHTCLLLSRQSSSQMYSGPFQI